MSHAGGAGGRLFGAVAGAKRAEFARLFREFAEAYPSTLEGAEHLRAYDEGRRSGRDSFEQIRAAEERGEDVTDRVLLELLPHVDTEGNRARGAWIHVAPAVRKDVKEWFEGVGWTEPEDWPRVAAAILRLLRRCDEDPGDLPGACSEFSGLPYSKGFQAGILTPILNALRPDELVIVNKKSLGAINHFCETAFRSRLADYPAVNGACLGLIDDLSQEMDQPGVAGMRPTDRFDVFSHWLMAVRGYDPGERPRYWKISPGRDAWQWENCRENGFVAVGWDEVGDASDMTREEFEARRDGLLAEHADDDDWTKDRVDQVWEFSRIKEGDRVVANRGTGQVLGIGTVVGPYEFVPNVRHGHRLPVEWNDLTPRKVSEGNWRRALLELGPQKFEALLGAPSLEGTGGSKWEADSGDDAADGPFSARTFGLLAELHEEPTRDFYQAHKDEFVEHLEEPFKGLFLRLAEALPPQVAEVMETKNRLFSRIAKNDYGQGGAWDFYWGAFYPKGGKRTKDAQLSMWINRDRLEFGFHIGDYGTEQRERFLRNREKHAEELLPLLRDALEDGVVFGEHKGEDSGDGGPYLEEWLRDPAGAEIDASVVLPEEQVLSSSEDELVGVGVRVFGALFPLVLLALHEEPMAAIAEYLGLEGEDEPNPPYTIEDCALETGFGEATLARWVRAIERKGQGILYGPPGTGKTFLAERLARHFTADGDGFWEVVQFHPAYAYEDFVLGIRPEPQDGVLGYPLVPGRFLEFCGEARKRRGPCVLVIDEINRADLSRVFGELMYLLEYRDREVPLAGGKRFAIPRNVRLIGTMNTADRSIALVDHALRRRFAFMKLYPDYGLLRRFHERSGFPVDKLEAVLRRVNDEIDDPDHEIGVTFFLQGALGEKIEDVWRMEIEPYLEEYFFAQRGRVEPLRWESIGEELVPS